MSESNDRMIKIVIINNLTPASLRLARWRKEPSPDGLLVKRKWGSERELPVETVGKSVKVWTTWEYVVGCLT